MNKNFLAFIAFIFVFLGAKAQQFPGYTFYSLKNSTTSQLIDTNGNVFHTWNHTTGSPTTYSSYMMPGGDVYRAVTKTGNSFTGGPIAGKVQKYDYNGNLLWDYTYSTTQYCSHHDICPMPNGNVLLIAYELISSTDVANAGCTGYTGVMWPDKIVEVQQTGPTTGTVVWEWRAWDHLVQNVNSAKANYYPSIIDHPELLNVNYLPKKDWMHANGVHYNPILDQIAVSSHNLNEIYVIDHSTTTAEAASHSGGNSGKGGDILYRWGNPAAYGATGTQIFKVVHDAHWIAEDCPNAGDLAGYNNQGISNNASCADIFTPPVSGYNYTFTAGTAFGPNTYNKRQASGGYNSNEGGSQQLPNGNMLVTMGISGYIKEFDPSGTLLWSKTLTGSTAKSFRYPECYVNFPAPAIPTISETTGVLTSTSATSYQWYLNGQQIAGATSQDYTPTQSGIYLVRIKDANGCVPQYSKGFNFTFTSKIQSQSFQNLVIYPNPSSSVFNIQGLNGNYIVNVIDMMGKTVKIEKNAKNIDLQEFNNGIYQLMIVNENAETITKTINLLK